MQLTVRDVAELLNISEKTVYRWVEDGKLPGYRLSGQYRFYRAELLEWATSKIFEETEANAVPLPELHECLQAGGVFYRLSGEDKPAVLKNVVEMLRLPDGVDRDYLLRVLLAREALESTGLGDGIAIPHVRNPVVLHIQRPLITLCFLEKPVDFGALDGKPVHALFTLVSPTVKAHLHLLSRLTFALRDAEFKGLIANEASRDEILAAAARANDRLPKPMPAEVVRQ